VEESLPEDRLLTNTGLWPRSRAIFAESLEAIADALDWLSLGVFLVDSDGEALFMNRSAADMLGEDAGIDLQGRRLIAFDPVQTHDLQDLICRAVSGSDSPHDDGCLAMPLRRSGARMPLSVIAVPLRRRPSKIFGRGLPATGHQATAMLFVSDPECDHQQSRDILIKLYGLTPAETELTLRLLDGGGVEGVAKQLSISMNTARTHLKHVFAKTNTKRQAELVNLLLRGPAALRLT